MERQIAEVMELTGMDRIQAYYHVQARERLRRENVRSLPGRGMCK